MRNCTCICVAIVLIIGFGCCSTYIVDLSTYEIPNRDLSVAGMDDNLQPQRAHGADMKQRQEAAASTPLHTEKTEQQMHARPESARVPRFIVEDNGFVGTNIVSVTCKGCFHLHDLAMLEVRKNFESLIPQGFPRQLLTDRQVCLLMRYFNRVHQMLRRLIDAEIKYYMQSAFYDTIGGYLRYRLLPAAQLSFYAGHLRLITVERLRQMYCECRVSLNTHGNGWRAPDTDLIEQLRRQVTPLKIKTCRTPDSDSCRLLDLHSIERDARNMQMLVALPELELENENGELTNIGLPFKERRIYNLRSPSSAFILVRFYMVLTRCYDEAGMCMETYNKRFREWIFESLYVHFDDEIFYPGLGGILRIFENLKRSKKPIDLQGFLQAQQMGDRYAADVAFDEHDEPTANTNYKRNIGFDVNMDADADIDAVTQSNLDADREDTLDTHADDASHAAEHDDAELDLLRYKSKLQRSQTQTQENNAHLWLPKSGQLNFGSELLNAQLPDGMDNYVPFLCILLLLLLVVIFYITCSKLYRSGKAPCRRYERLQRRRPTSVRDSRTARQQMSDSSEQSRPKRKRMGRNPRNYCIKCYRRFGFQLGFKREQAPEDELIIITSDSKSVLPSSRYVSEEQRSRHGSFEDIERQSDLNESQRLLTAWPNRKGRSRRSSKLFLPFVDEDNITSQSEDSDQLSSSTNSDSEPATSCACRRQRANLLEWGKRSVNNIKSSYEKLSARNRRFNTN